MEKVCPMCFGIEVNDDSCIEEKCAWYNEKAKGCGMRFVKVQ